MKTWQQSFFFNTPSAKTTKAIFEEYAGELSHDELKQMILRLKERKFAHLVFSLRHPSSTKVFTEAMSSESNCKKIFLEEMVLYYDEMNRYFDEENPKNPDRSELDFFIEVCEKLGYSPKEKEYLKARFYADDPSLTFEENYRDGLRFGMELLRRIREKLH